jgi:hypothetical protein
MKIKKLLSIALVSFFIASCATTTKFPVSDAAPAADISVKKKKDNNNNYVVEVTAKNLAEASRLNPPRSNYNVWIVTENGITKNIGQLSNRNARTASLKTVTPFDVREIFITAENQGDLSYPSGAEITRTTLK